MFSIQSELFCKENWTKKKIICIKISYKIKEKNTLFSDLCLNNYKVLSVCLWQKIPAQVCGCNLTKCDVSGHISAFVGAASNHSPTACWQDGAISVCVSGRRLQSDPVGTWQVSYGNLLLTYKGWRGPRRGKIAGKSLSYKQKACDCVHSHSKLIFF